MASFQSRIFNFIVRNQHLMRGRLKKERFDLNTPIAGFRERCEKGADRYAKIPGDITIRPDTIEGIKSEFLIPKSADEGKLIFYIHGGGYVSGSCNDHRGFVSKFARYTGITNLTFEYRLAPEHPFPAALDDTVSVYKRLLRSGYRPCDIVFAGESAGGGLLLSTLLFLRDHGIPLPAAGVAISPWTDLTCSGESYKTKNKVSPAPLDSWFVFSKHYIACEKADNPYVSPLFGNMAGLPPILINSGTDDELFDDGEIFFLKAQRAGVDIVFREGEGMVHCYPLLAPLFPEATHAMNEIVRFIRKYLSEGSATT